MSSGIFNAAGTRLTKSAVTTVPADDPEVKLTMDLYTHKDVGRTDTPINGVRTLLFRAGSVLRTSTLNRLFPAVRFSGASPARGAVAGGTVVTLSGNFLDGVTGVTFGGVAGTALKVVDGDTVQVTAPAHAAGTVDLVITDEGVAQTFTGAFTYA